MTEIYRKQVATVIYGVTRKSMQGCAMKKLKEKDAYWNNFIVKDFKDMSLKDHIGRVGGHIKMIFLRMIQHSIKIFSTVLVIHV